MEKRRFNSANTKEAPKIGSRGGEKPPPGRYVFGFQVAKSDISENKKARTNGDQLVIFEFVVVRVLSGGEPKPDWQGNIRTAPIGARRSWVLNMKGDRSLGQLNEIALFLHGVNARDPSELRSLGVIALDDTSDAIRKAANEMDDLCNAVVDAEKNTLLNVRIECEVKDIETEKDDGSKRTFIAYNFGLCADPADLEHNAKILGADVAA